MNPRLVRGLGTALIILGFGSAFARTRLGIDTVLTTWMGSAQPVSGIVMGAIGLVLFGVGVKLMQARDARLEALDAV
ncbi:MAG: hypothetical protein IPH03_00980 [Tetrasphaera sp.]|jgi:hypothetical protein|nr:hypothetical protein [Tetrasphaera sp.]